MATDAKLKHIASTLQPRSDASPDRWAHWQPAELFMRSRRRQVAAQMLTRAGKFPQRGDPCLEVGYGSLGWMGDLISWGMRTADLHGIELDAERARIVQEALPGAGLKVGDATELPWDDQSFQLVIASTVFTSVPEASDRRLMADEITRVMAPGGVLLWYDFAVNSPTNPYVRRVSRGEVRELFPQLNGAIRSLTLAPPLLRMIAPWSWPLAILLESIPLLRTHLMAVLLKPSDGSDRR